LTIYLLVITAFLLAFLIAIYQKVRGLSFWSSFFKSLIAVSGVLGVIWKILD
tara:strand:- start:279 stop:434 length:156 start_codon:yes stop_codon:yes gene_type:complete